MKLINPEKFIVPGLILSVGSYQVYGDYKKADAADRKNVLQRDILILGGACAGAVTGNAYFAKAFSNHSIKTSKFLTCLIEDLSVPIGGIIGGAITGEIAEKLFPLKHASIEKIVKETLKQKIEEKQRREKFLNDGNHLVHEIDPGTVAKAYGYLGMGLGATFDHTFSTLSGFKVGKEKGIKNKLFKATYEIIAGVLIPVTTVVSLASYLKTKNMEPLLKAAIIAPASIVSCFVGTIVAEWFNKKVLENVVKNEYWNQLAEHQKKYQNVLSFNNFNKIKLNNLNC